MLFFILNNANPSWFHLSQLYSLGLEAKHMYFGLIFLGIIFGYILIKPMITWFIILESSRMLTYLISSLIIILIFFIVILFTGGLPGNILGFLHITLNCLAVWGVTIFLYLGYHQMIKLYNYI